MSHEIIFTRNELISLRWKQTTPIPSIVASMPVNECVPAPFKDCKIVFSGLDSDVAGDIGAHPDVNTLADRNSDVRVLTQRLLSELLSLLSSPMQNEASLIFHRRYSMMVIVF